MRIGKKIWHSRRINELDAEIPEYDTPTSYVTRPNYLTIMPASSRGYLEILKYGETADNVWTGTANARQFVLKEEFIIGKSILGTGKTFAKAINFGDYIFQKGDLMWVDGESPIASLEKKNGVGSTANAVIKSVLEVGHTISLVLERNQNQLLK